MKTVILLRHADVDATTGPAPNSFPLNAAGVQRSNTLKHVLGGAGVTAIFASPAARTQQTVAPLATQLGLTVSVPATQAALISSVLSTASGAVVVIAGHSNTVPQIISDLGGSAAGINILGHDDLFIVTIIAASQTSQVHLKYGKPSP
jgi:phosphohistidine phosphatase SixA